MMLLIAGLLSILVGLVHSFLGEYLIFRKLRDGSVVPTVAPSPLHEKHIRILWATWHIASFFGWALGAILIHLSLAGQIATTTILQVIGLSMFVSGILVLYATKAKHPGWIGLLGVAALCWLA